MSAGLIDMGCAMLHFYAKATFCCAKTPLQSVKAFCVVQKQLSCRILVKVIPHSVSLISSSEEGGGGNRISEDQIKSYLDEALGEGPRPMWGLPGGWGDYCASKSNAGQAHDMYITHPPDNGVAACIAPCRAKLLLLFICSNAHQQQQSVKLCALPSHNTGGCFGLEHLQQDLCHIPFCHHSSGLCNTSCLLSADSSQ